jgi:endonuclease/exonuclease/phosphatase family metal-dependent hydrolase
VTATIVVGVDVSRPTLRVVSWNIQQGGGRRVAAHVEALREQEPDVVALQEVFPSAIAAYREHLARIGLRYLADSFSWAADPAVFVRVRRYGNLIASRWPLVLLDPAPFVLPWQERAVSVLLCTPWGAIEAHSVYLPMARPDSYRAETLEGIYAGLAQASQRPRILCGDINGPQAELADGQIVTFAARRRRNGGFVLPANKEYARRCDTAERAILKGLAAFDLPDVYRALHGYQAQDCSWYWRHNGRSGGFRLDHMLASLTLNPVSCEYLHSLRRVGLSDHAPLAATFEPRAGRNCGRA